MLNILAIYYLFIFIMAGIIGTPFILLEYEVEIDNPIKTIFMYQYAIYEMVKDRVNIFGIILLEAFVTFSVWFLNIIVFIVIIVGCILWAICMLFLVIFKKRG